MGILYGCASNPKELVLDKTQVAISYEKVESLDYWIIGKRSEERRVGKECRL